jgi:hypothetical protein
MFCFVLESGIEEARLDLSLIEADPPMLDFGLEISETSQLLGHRQL